LSAAIEAMLAYTPRAALTERPPPLATRR
jgi:hypothetical protein